MEVRAVVVVIINLGAGKAFEVGIEYGERGGKISKR